jgi:hypothetical protein
MSISTLAESKRSEHRRVQLMPGPTTLPAPVTVTESEGGSAYGLVVVGEVVTAAVVVAETADVAAAVAAAPISPSKPPMAVPMPIRRI